MHTQQSLLFACNRQAIFPSYSPKWASKENHRYDDAIVQLLHEIFYCTIIYIFRALYETLTGA